MCFNNCFKMRLTNPLFFKLGIPFVKQSTLFKELTLQNIQVFNMLPLLRGKFIFAIDFFSNKSFYYFRRDVYKNVLNVSFK